MTKQEEECIREHFTYDPDSGKVFWRKSRGNVRAGAEAGNIMAHNYRCIMLNKKTYYTHRIAWFLQTGRWPKEIDHINRNPSDNRWENLRAADRLVNSLNSSRHTAKTHGVHWCNALNKWQVVFRIKGKAHYYGRYANYDDAVTAACKAKEELGILYKEDSNGDS